MVIPGLGKALASTVVSTRTITLTTPPELSTITETQALPLQTTTVTVDPTPGPIQTYAVPVRNECEAGSVVLVSAPNNPDFMVIDAVDHWAQYSVDVVSANQSLTFTPCNGRILCTLHTFDEYYHCDWVGQPQTVPDREQLTLTCPEESNFPVSPPYTGYGTSPVNVQIGSTCPYIVTKISCSRYETCIVDAYPNTTPDVSFIYPWLAPLRIKAVGSGWARAQWSVSYANTNYGGPMSYDQPRGTWLDITPQPFADTGLISVVVECKTTEEIQVRVYNACLDPVILGIPEAWDWVALQSGNDRTFYLEKDNPTASLTPLSGQLLCAYNERTAVDYCDYEMLYFSMLDQDVIKITCPNDSPPAVDLTGKTVDLSMETSSMTLNFALQIDCVPGNPCPPIYSEGGSQSFDTLYPVTSPTTRLCVRAFGSILPARMFYAEWSVQFSGGPATTLVQANAQWLDIKVSSDATSIKLYGSAFYGPAPEPAPEPEPATGLSLGIGNYCGGDALISSPGESDLFFFPTNSGLGISAGFVNSDDPRVLFTSLTGRHMCAVVERTGSTECETDGIVASGLRDSDQIRLECPDNGPPRPVADNNIPVSISTTATSPHLVIQIGCEKGGSCPSYTAGNSAYRLFDYPMLEPMLRFRVRVFASTGYGERLSYVQWQVGLSNGLKEIYYQPKGQWLEILIPSDATSIEIEGNGFESGSTPEPGPVTMMRLGSMAG